MPGCTRVNLAILHPHNDLRHARFNGCCKTAFASLMSSNSSWVEVEGLFESLDYPRQKRTGSRVLERQHRPGPTVCPCVPRQHWQAS